MNTSYETILAVLKATDSKAIDDHFPPDHCFDEIKIEAIAEIAGTVVGIVTPRDGFPTTGLNKLYIGEDHRVHVSKLGIAVLNIYRGDIEKAIDKHNSNGMSSSLRKVMYNRQIVNVTTI